MCQNTNTVLRAKIAQSTELSDRVAEQSQLVKTMCTGHFKQIR